MGRCLEEHTAVYRYPGPINTNQRKRSTNLIPFPRLKFMKCGLSERGVKNYMESALEDEQQLMFGVNRNEFRVMTTGVHIRDPLCYESEIDERTKKKITSLNNTLCEWIPNNIHSSITNQTNV